MTKRSLHLSPQRQSVTAYADVQLRTSCAAQLARLRITQTFTYTEFLGQLQFKFLILLYAKH
jgi:hypothetical protein